MTEAVKEKPKKKPRQKVTRSPTPLVKKNDSHIHGAHVGYRLYEERFCELVPPLYKNGLTDVEVAVAIGICKSVFYDWRKLYPEFDAAVRYGKDLSHAYWCRMGKDGAEGEKKMNDRIWHLFMRNAHGWDKEEKDTGAAIDQKLEAIKQLAEKALENKQRDY